MVAGRSTPPQGLPVETTGFVGREAELARLTALLGPARLVTVTGPGGVGKTRLALRAAATTAAGFTDGACLAELSGLREPGQVVPAVAAALGLPVGPRQPALDTVLAYLGDRHLLLILDTCEHLVDACAMFAEAVIARAPRVTMLATSREPLDVSGENACPLTPLPVPAPDGQDADGLVAGQWASPGDYPGGDYRGTAVELFLQRASAAVPGFTVGATDMPQVVRLCRRLDGMPLAIELAAVRLRVLPLAELAGRLDQRLALLTSGHRGRNRTLRDSIRWSHDLCTPAERTLWARLSVFGGPFTMQAAEEVCGEPGEDPVLPAVIRLVDKSVLTRIGPAADGGWADGGGQPTRYLMLDTIREFGAERLAVMVPPAAAPDRLIARYLAMAGHFRDHFLDDDQLDLLRELRSEHANVTAALRCALGDGAREGAGPAGRTAAGVALATALSGYWQARGLAAEGGYWLGRAIAAAPPGSGTAGGAFAARGRLRAVRGEAGLALADAARARGVAASLGDERLAGHGHLVESLARCASGDLAAAAEAADAARLLLTTAGDQAGLIDLDAQLAYLALLKGNIEDALWHVEDGLRRLGGSRERLLHAGLYLLASLALSLDGRDAEASWTVTQALAVKQETGDILGIAVALEISGWLAARSGAWQRAAWLLGGADALWQRAGGRLAAGTAFERAHADAVAGTGETLGAERFADLFARARRQPPGQLAAFALNSAAGPDDATLAGASPGGASAAAESGASARLPSQLTVREREIASLVAAGLSNRQVAEKLYISRRTVDAHLEHIFGKLGITSRVMLTIQLREHSGPIAAKRNG